MPALRKLSLPVRILISTLFAGAEAAYAFACFQGPDAAYRLWYYTPAAAAAGAFVCDRIIQRPGWRRWALDGAVALTCAARPLWGFPPLSGHALFAVHALMTAKTRWNAVLAGLLTVMTIYVKIHVRSWDRTLWPGLAAGLVTGWVWRRLRGNGWT